MNTYEVFLTASYSAPCYLKKIMMFLFRGNLKDLKK